MLTYDIGAKDMAEAIRCAFFNSKKFNYFGGTEDIINEAIKNFEKREGEV